MGGGGDYFASGVVLGETPRGGDGLDVETGLVARLERRESRDAGKRRARFGARLGRGVRHPGPQGEVGVDHARERGVDERGSLLGPRNEGTALEEHPRRLTLGRRGGAKGAWRRQTRDEVVGVTLRVACVKHPGAELEGGGARLSSRERPGDAECAGHRPTTARRRATRARSGVRPPRVVRESLEVSFRCQLRRVQNTTTRDYFLRVSPLTPVARASRVSISKPRAITRPRFLRPRPPPPHTSGAVVLGATASFPIAPLLPEMGHGMPTVAHPT